MVKRSSQYPLGQLVLQSIEASQLSAGNFVSAIGYRNPSKGVRALDSLVRHGSQDPVFFERLNASQFAPPREAFESALKETLAILAEEARLYAIEEEAEKRAAFRPFIQGVPELDMPTQITLHALTGGSSRFTIELPASFPNWALEDQYRYAEEKIVSHYAACEGRTLFMGRLTAYRLFRFFGEDPLLLSVTGKPLGLIDGKPLQEAALAIGGRLLSEWEASKLFTEKE